MNNENNTYSKTYVSLTDVTGGCLVEVLGLKLDVMACVEIIRTGDMYEIDFLDVEAINISLTNGGELRLDVANLGATQSEKIFFEAVFDRIEKLAIDLARDLPLSEWKTESYEIV